MAERNLIVSRQHALLPGRDHVARAIHLSKSTKGISIADGKRKVSYFNLMLDPAKYRSFFKAFPDLQSVRAKGLDATDFFGAPDAQSKKNDAYCQRARPFMPRLSRQVSL